MQMNLQERCLKEIMMLTSKQRAYLRSLSNELEPIFQIGKGGISEEMCLQLSNALEARELIKVKVLENSGYTAREAAEEIASYIGADVVSVIGLKFVLYKESQKHKRIEL
jgi:RNA-binding protein